MSDPNDKPTFLEYLEHVFLYGEGDPLPIQPVGMFAPDPGLRIAYLGEPVPVQLRDGSMAEVRHIRRIALGEPLSPWLRYFMARPDATEGA